MLSFTHTHCQPEGGVFQVSIKAAGAAGKGILSNKLTFWNWLHLHASLGGLHRAKTSLPTAGDRQHGRKKEPEPYSHGQTCWEESSS